MRRKQGFTEKFPIASVSIAIVTNEREVSKTIEDLSERIVKAKKLAKQKQGNAISILP